MKEEGDAFSAFRDSFSKLQGNFHVLEQRVPVETQMEYFKYSGKVRKENDPPRPLSDQRCEELYADLMGAEEMALKQHFLAELATSKSVRGYRLLEEYVAHPDPEVVDWAHLALMEARISLECDLSDEKQIYISSGLGGKGGKLRFFVLMTAKGGVPFEDFQRGVIERETAYYLAKEDCEIERLTIADRHVALVLLLPFQADFKGMIERIISECNQYGNFLSMIFTVTNVKEPTPEEIEDIIVKNGND